MNIEESVEVQSAPQSLALGEYTSDRPALAAFLGYLYCAWKIAGKYDLYCSSTKNGKDWSGKTSIPGGSNSGPDLEHFKNKLYVAWKGAASDSQIWYTYSERSEPPPKWEPQRRVPGAFSDDGPALTAFNDYLYLAWRAPDSSIRYLVSRDGKEWQSFPKLPVE